MIRPASAIARGGDPAAIPLFASWMGQPGLACGKIAEALVEMSPQVVPFVRKGLEALDEHMIRNTRRVLAALRDTFSQRAQYGYYWTDLEEALVGHDAEEDVAES